MTTSPVSRQRLALVVPGLEYGGGVPRVAEFIQDVGESAGFDVTRVSLAVAWNAACSTRLTAPRTYRMRRHVHRQDSGDVISGAWFSELEPMRYLQTQELRTYLGDFDVVQVVAGTPAWAMAVRDIDVPVALQIATLTRWERGRWMTGKQTHRVQRISRGLMSKVVDRLDLMGVRIPDAVLVENSAMYAWTVATRGGSEGVHLRPPGVDLARFSPGGDGWASDGPLISVGRFGDSRKGLDRLLDAYTSLVGQWSEAPQLMLVGSGEVPSELRAQLERPLLRGRVVTRVDVTDAELVGLLRQSSLFVATPHEEGLGLAAIEAMACGLPVVVTQTAGSREYVVPGETGYALPQTSPALIYEFGAKVRRILSSDDGPAMSAAARALCEGRFDQEEASVGFREVLSGLIGPG